jgi:hypothetical protein
MFTRPTPASSAYIVEESSREVDIIKSAVLKHYPKYNITYGFSVADENVIANAT